MIFMALVGGLGTFEGPILGAIVFFVLQDELGDHGVWYLVGLGHCGDPLRAVPAARALGRRRGAVRHPAAAGRVLATRS